MNILLYKRLCLSLLSLYCLIIFSDVYAANRPLVGFGKLSTSAELNYSRDRQITSQTNQADTHFNSDQFRENLHLRDQGVFIVDPRLINLDLGASIGLFQEKDNFAGQDASQHGHLEDYNVLMSILSQKPYNLLLHADRAQDRITRNFGTRTNTTTTSRGGRINLREEAFFKTWKIPYFSTSLSINQLTIDESSSGNGQNFQRNEDHNIIQYDAHKGYQTADLQFHYQFDDIKNTLLKDNGFTSHTANLTYSLDFGPTLNRRWNATANYIRYNGLRNTSSLTTNQTLNIRHNINLFSNYQYGYNRFITSSGATTTQLGSILISQQFYKNMNASLNGQASRVDLPAGKTSSYGAGAGLSYHHQLPSNGRLNLHANNNYRINDNNLSNGQIDIQAEPHTVSSTFPTGVAEFFLNHRLVKTNSIVIVDRRGGAQIAMTVGIDYTIITDVDRTRIRLLPTSATIQANDPLEVDYQYQVAPSVRFSTVVLNVGASIDYGWLSFSLAHDASQQNLISGQDNGFLQNRQINTADLQLNGHWRRLDASAGFNYQVENDSNQKYRRWRFDQTASYANVLGLTLIANTSESVTNFQLPRPRNTNSYSGNLSLNGMTSNGWQMRLFTSILVLNDSEVDNQSTRRAGIVTSRRYGKMTVRGDLLLDNFERGTSSTNDERIDINIVRSF